VIAFGGAMWRNTTKEVNVTEQYTHAELLLAKEVRGAAYQLRRSETPRHLLSSDDSATQAELADWQKSHPIDAYYRRTLSDYTEAADIIRGILKP
jgi:hypothetical protein